MLIAQPYDIESKNEDDDDKEDNDENDDNNEPDAGAIEIDDNNGFDPNSLTPAEQRVYRHSPIRTRSRAKHDDLLMHCEMTQISMKQGIKMYGDWAKKALPMSSINCTT